jgi:hypothetical protein
MKVAAHRWQHFLSGVHARGKPLFSEENGANRAATLIQACFR